MAAYMSIIPFFNQYVVGEDKFFDDRSAEQEYTREYAAEIEKCPARNSLSSTSPTSGSETACLRRA
jgi:hypothetical protein